MNVVKTCIILKFSNFNININNFREYILFFFSCTLNYSCHIICVFPMKIPFFTARVEIGIQTVPRTEDLQKSSVHITFSPSLFHL